MLELAVALSFGIFDPWVKHLDGIAIENLDATLFEMRKLVILEVIKRIVFEKAEAFALARASFALRFTVATFGAIFLSFKSSARECELVATIENVILRCRLNMCIVQDVGRPV